MPTQLARAKISNSEAEAEVFLQGAHLTSWIPRGHKPVLFISSHSVYELGKPIRGGVPIVFPWFGPRHDGGAGPAHGLARIALWHIVEEEPEITLALRIDDVDLRFRVNACKSLTMTLSARNLSSEPLVFENALHSYFAVGDIRQASVFGLEGTTYLDKTDGMRRKVRPAEPITFNGETDQVHVNTEAACVIDDPVWNRRITLAKTGSRSTVVWNPWIEKAAAMGDFGPDEWQRMVCVETANVAENAVTLSPGETHEMTVAISLLAPHYHRHPGGTQGQMIHPVAHREPL